MGVKDYGSVLYNCEDDQNLLQFKNTEISDNNSKLEFDIYDEENDEMNTKDLKQILQEYIFDSLNECEDLKSELEFRSEIGCTDAYLQVKIYNGTGKVSSEFFVKVRYDWDRADFFVIYNFNQKKLYFGYDGGISWWASNNTYKILSFVGEKIEGKVEIVNWSPREFFILREGLKFLPKMTNIELLFLAEKLKIPFQNLVEETRASLFSRIRNFLLDQLTFPLQDSEKEIVLQHFNYDFIRLEK